MSLVLKCCQLFIYPKRFTVFLIGNKFVSAGVGGLGGTAGLAGTGVLGGTGAGGYPAAGAGAGGYPAAGAGAGGYPAAAKAAKYGNNSLFY